MDPMARYLLPGLDCALFRCLLMLYARDQHGRTGWLSVASTVSATPCFRLKNKGFGLEHPCESLRLAARCHDCPIPPGRLAGVDEVPAAWALLVKTAAAQTSTMDE
ncbi:hypothetical protein CGRA01v4_00209 [Colletotrichum graminicola]|nr:hypothetical protein CGRA01v4_00209 [Colletotrichum graminicola]